MFLPIGDDNSKRQRMPYVVISLIIANVAAFIWQLLQSETTFTTSWAATPWELLNNQDLDGAVRVVHGDEAVRIDHGAGPGFIYLTLLSSMFLHAGWLHLLGNMLFLWIFGDQIEDRLGHVRFLLFYLLTGLVAGGAHVASYIGAPVEVAAIPSLGASGAISGVLGAYLLRHPFNRIKILVLFVIITVIEVPALIVLGLWIAKEVISGIQGTNGNVAVLAHIGGFVAGLLLIVAFEPDRSRRLETPWMPNRRTRR